MAIVFAAIPLLNGEDVMENKSRHFEADAVLDSIGGRLALAPFEMIINHDDTARP
jgi:hypothetical protein